MATFEQAKMAKLHALEILRGRVDLAGIGIRGSGVDYSLSAHVISPSVDDLPQEIDGVSVAYKLVGPITLSNENESQNERQPG